MSSLLLLPAVLPAALAAAPPVDLLAGTRAPLEVGVRARSELPGRVLVGASAGFLPGAYVDLINGVAMSFGAYERPTADVIRAAIQSSLVLGADVGWRPFRRAGWTVGLGTSLVTLGGDATAQELVVAATGIAAPDEATGPLGRRPAGDALSYDLGARLVVLRPELGWHRVLGERWLVDLGLGGLFTVDAATRLEPEFEPLVPALQEAFTTETAAWLDETMETWVHSPTLTVGFGVRLGGR